MLIMWLKCIASTLKASKLIYLTDVDGLMIDKELRSTLQKKEARDLLNHPDVSGGMLPKLSCSISAIEEGVKTSSYH